MRRVEKKMYWPINAVLFNLCKLFPFRDKRIWIFGAWEGEKYDDNSRYLYEYVNSCYNDQIHTIWLSEKKDIVENVRQTGGEAYLSNSRLGKWFSLRAGVVIYSHGLMDFGTIPFVGGAKVVSLWHGVGFKKIYNDNYHGWKLKTKKLFDKFFSWTYRDLTIVTSIYVKSQFSSIFGLNSSDAIAFCGQPRNDIFKKSLIKKNDFVGLNIDCKKKWVIYMPTYRGKGLGDNAMSCIVKRLYESKRLYEVLRDENCIFIVKLHPLTPHINLERRDNFLILDYGDVESNQELLGISDILITDYSSCCVDFALLNRPIIFYQPDEEEFMSKSEPLYEELIDVLHTNRCSTPEELAEKIANPSLEVVQRLNDVFEDESIRDTCYSENVYKAICKEFEI
ncbi:MAG: CDP-glycerol glycerophosphotransferase family protein [Bacteroidaceae bacterium]|nr:CDP-glycerol glycerophosphotransferase family protein [Bacteroidaceae bacterium]